MDSINLLIGLGLAALLLLGLFFIASNKGDKVRRRHPYWKVSDFLDDVTS